MDAPPAKNRAAERGHIVDTIASKAIRGFIGYARQPETYSGAAYFRAGLVMHHP
jgi:hypothetical protein